MKLLILCLSLLMYVPLMAENQSVVAYDSKKIFFGQTSALFEFPKNNNEGDSKILVVALHGCTQTAESFRGASELSLKGSQKSLYFLYPEQSVFRNINRCWNWFLQPNQSTGYGESFEIIRLIEGAAADQNIPSENIYLVGFSAGAGQGANLLACYPNFFKKAFLHSGPSYAVANLFNASRVLKNGTQSIGNRTYLCDPSEHTQPLFVFHGANDTVVHSSHIGLYAKDFKNAKVQATLLPGLGHDWSGGNSSYPYTNPSSESFTDLIIENIDGT